MATQVGRDSAEYPGFTGETFPYVFTTLPPQPTVKKPGQLPLQKVQEYFENGFLVVEDVFTTEELEPVRDSFRRRVDDLAHKLYKTGLVKNLYEDHGLKDRLIMLEKEWEGSVMLILKLVKLIPPCTKTKLLDIIEQLVGPVVGANPIWNTRPKTPGHAETHVPWHQGDNPETDIIRCPVKAGGLVLFSNMIPHRSIANQSDHIRWAMDLRIKDANRPWGYYGIKQGISLRSPDEPGLVPDCDPYDGQDRYEILELPVEEKTGQSGGSDDFSTLLPGPHMDMWNVLRRSRHTDHYFAEKAKKELANPLKKQ